MARRGVVVSEIDVAAQLRLLEVRRELERLMVRGAARRASSGAAFMSSHPFRSRSPSERLTISSPRLPGATAMPRNAGFDRRGRLDIMIHDSAIKRALVVKRAVEARCCDPGVRHQFPDWAGRISPLPGALHRRIENGIFVEFPRSCRPTTCP